MTFFDILLMILTVLACGFLLGWIRRDLWLTDSDDMYEDMIVTELVKAREEAAQMRSQLADARAEIRHLKGEPD